jgi:hypothetical protein
VSGRRFLPSLVVIGAQKCGTTSLHYYLGLHPQISMAGAKELDFFVADRNWSRGVEWYKSHFTRPTPVRGESSPAYSNHPWFPDVPRRMASILPDARLIYLVRDPIQRIISHYLQRLSLGFEQRALSEALADAGPSNLYLSRSLYHWQLQQFLPFYPLERILIVATEDLYQRRLATLRRIFTFLDVDPDFSSSGFARVKFRSQELRRLSPWGLKLRNHSYAHLNRAAPGLQRFLTYLACYPLSQRMDRPVVSESQRHDLSAALWPDVQQLRALSGQAFAQWSL